MFVSFFVDVFGLFFVVFRVVVLMLVCGGVLFSLSRAAVRWLDP